MSYERFLAAPDVKDFVEHIWFVRSPAFSEPRREILIPNGRATVVICLADPGTRYDPLTGAGSPNGTVMFGVITRPFVLEQLGPSSYLGAQLAPWGLSALLTDDRLVDDFRRVEDWLGGPVTRRLEEDLRSASNGAHAAELLTEALAGHATQLDPRMYEPLRRGVELIEESRGMISVGELGERLGYSRAALYRLFRHYIGVGPKQFCEIIRYFHFTGSLLAGGDSAALLSGLHGYYDQAHAARHFKRFTGISASRFVEVTDGIARLMHANDSYKTA